MEDIEIYDKTGQNITGLFKGWCMNNSGIITNGVDPFEVYSSPSISSFIKSINSHDYQTRGTKVESYRIFYVNVNSSNKFIAKKIQFKNRIENVVEDTTVIYKVRW